MSGQPTFEHDDGFLDDQVRAVALDDFAQGVHALGRRLLDLDRELADGADAAPHEVDVDLGDVVLELVQDHVDVGLVGQLDHDLELLVFDVERVRKVAEEVLQLGLDDERLLLGQNGDVLERHELQLGLGRQKRDQAGPDALAERAHSLRVLHEVQVLDDHSDRGQVDARVARTREALDPDDHALGHVRGRRAEVRYAVQNDRLPPLSRLVQSRQELLDVVLVQSDLRTARLLDRLQRVYRVGHDHRVSVPEHRPHHFCR